MVASVPLLLEQEHAHGVVQLTLNRPGALNALNAALYAALARALQHHSGHPPTKILVLTGAGARTFTAGMDLKEASDPSRAPDTIAAARAFMRALLDFRKPVFAAVFGAVRGIGVTLLMHCDAVWGGVEAEFETPFAEIGIVAEFGSSWMFPRMLGVEMAGRLLLRGEAVTAQEMERVGVLKVVKGGREQVVREAVEKAVGWSERVGGERWEAVLEGRQLMKEGVRKATERAMEREFEAIDRQTRSGTVERLMKRKVGEMGRRRGKL